jgi:hypothetical protein
MRVYAHWYGGSSYSAPTNEDTEEFSSIQSAKDAFWRRADFDPYYPCVEDSSMLLYFSDPRETNDPYPDRELTLGPRGGIRSTPC